MTETAERSAGSWRALLSREHLGAIVVLAGGVVLYATNVYLTTSLLPSAIREIGGERLYAWNTTVFLLASVVSAVLVGLLLARLGGRGAYLLAIGLFVAGTVICAAAPAMPVLLLGRAVQGAGGGLLAGLSYALIRSTLPQALWARGSALVSAMWGVGTFVGPAVGGAFAQFASWRTAFVALAIGALLIAALIPRVLPAGRSPGVERASFPLLSLVLLAAATLSVSVASLFATAAAGISGVAVGAVLIVVFLAYERKGGGILPKATFSRQSRLPWIYGTIAVLAIGSTVETFVPLFGQRLAGLPPVVAGFLGAALAAGWTLGELPSASAVRPSAIRRIVIAGPLVLGAGLAMTALTQRSTSDGWMVALWALTLVVAGSGIGMAWPHLATAAMASVENSHEGDKAAAAINTVQLVANAFGAALTGVVVNLGEPDTQLSAQWLFGSFAVIAAIGVLTAYFSQRRQAS
jgi:MFS family permease